MRIDFFFFESEGGGTEFHPIDIYVCRDIGPGARDPYRYWAGDPIWGQGVVRAGVDIVKGVYFSGWRSHLWS